MQAHTDFANRAQAWAREIDEALATRSQLTRRGMLLVFGLVASVCSGLLLQGWLTQRGPAYQGLMLTLLVALAMLGWLYTRQRIPSVVVLAVCSAMILNHLAGVYFNGVLALMLLSPFVVMTHLLLNPAPALALTVLLLGVAQGLVWAFHPQIPREIWLRATGINLGLLVILQLVTRHWLRVSLGFRDISRDMVSAQRDSERALEESKADRDSALYIDAPTGLPNRAGFERALRNLATRAGPEQRNAVLVWGLQPEEQEGSDAMERLRALALQASKAPGAVANADDQAVLVGLDESGQLLALLPAELNDENPWAVRIQGWVDTWKAAAAARSGEEARCCVGFAVWPDDGPDTQTVLRRAELARDMARSLGSDQPVRFETEMEERTERQARLLADMEAGLARGEFELHYQPIVSSAGDPLHKAEALIRWNHPQRGRISPGEFIPVAEQSYLIVEMTDKILEMAAYQVRQWRQDLHPDFQISVNMPPAYLAKCARHPGQMLPRLQALRAPLHSLVLEITEGALLEVDDELLQALQLVRDQGFLIALDDFGIGYSSFSKLPRLPLDFLKLDKTFVDALERGAEAQGVCHTLVSLAHDLGMQVVAEGIEGDAQRVLLLHMSTDFFQGYLFSRPLAARDFVTWARSQDQLHPPVAGGASARPAEPPAA